jgi:glutathione S-transferase
MGVKPREKRMKLYVTLTSPYARLARAVIIEKGLQDRAEVIPIQTRTPDSPLYAINPSGRVPTLVTDDGTMFEDSGLICAYLDHLDGSPLFEIQRTAEGWAALRAEVRVRSMLDGIAVWGRELYRPPTERSPGIIAHETARAQRMAAALDGDVAAALFDGPLSIAQLLLACTLHTREDRLPDFQWRQGNDHLSAWVDRFSERPSIQQTTPPPHPSENAH